MMSGRPAQWQSAACRLFTAWAAAAFYVLTGCTACAATGWQIVQQKGSAVLEVTARKGGHHTLEIDDAFAFRTPVLKKDFSGSKLQIHALELGLIPGIEYHARLDGHPDMNDFRILLSTFSQPEVSCDNLRRTWEETGRRAAGNSHSRVEWNEGKRTWVPLESHPLIGTGLYYGEYYLRPTLNAARACHDLDLLDEVSKYYVVMLQYAEPIGTLLRRPDVVPVTRERMKTADLRSLTFPADLGGGKVTDGELYNSQWLHPAAELLRFISLLPPRQRTPAMQSFAAQYTNFIVVDQLDRYLVQQRLPLPGGTQTGGRIALWNRDMTGVKSESPWTTTFTDIDLWLMASAAEVLGANANDPALVPLTAPQSEMLRQTIATGSRFVESRRNDYPATKNFRGEQVGSVAYGNGDLTARRDWDYSGVTSEKLPTPAEKQRLPDAGWDISHSYRFPVFMRALYENRKASGVDWPSYHELQLFTNQYVYRVFNGDYSRPLFHNYLDGSDGWYAVKSDGVGSGYPPSRYCDQHNRQRPCMTTAAIMGWGNIAFANPDLAEVEQSLVKLALDPNPQAQQFRNRYYFDDTPFEVLRVAGKQIYAMPLYFVIGDNAEMIASH